MAAVTSRENRHKERPMNYFVIFVVIITELSEIVILLDFVQANAARGE